MPTIAAPADSPKMVTLFGSPPKAAMLALTHLSAAMASASAWLPDALRPDSFVSSGCAKKPKRAEAVVEVDEHHALLREVLAVVVRTVAAAFAVCAAKDPEHDRPPVVGAIGLRPDVQVEAILTRLGGVGKIGRDVHRLPLQRRALHAGAGEGLHLAHARPLRHRLRLPPAEIANRRRAERDALEGADAGRQRGAGDLSGVGLDRIADLRSQPARPPRLPRRRSLRAQVCSSSMS